MRIEPAGLRELEETHKTLCAATAAGDGVLVLSLNHSFHRGINLIANAPRLAWLLSISSRFAPRRFFSTIPAWYKASAQDHTAILNAITERDAEQARAAMMRHMENAGDLLAANFESADTRAGNLAGPSDG